MYETTIDWESNFITGHSDIDKQHKYLFVLIRAFADAYMLKEEKDILVDMLFQLEDYTKIHFDDEEKILETAKGLPSSKHKEQHREFLRYLHDLKFDFVSENKPIGAELLDFLLKWLRDHILGVDKEELGLATSKNP